MAALHTAHFHAILAVSVSEIAISVWPDSLQLNGV